MKIFKIILFSVIVILTIALLALRIRTVNRAESTTTILAGLDEESEFLAAVYYPVSEKIIINDSMVFHPGKIFIQDAVKLKHHFFIFSSYYEKSASNWKNITYESSGSPNQYGLVLDANRNDTTFNEVTYTLGEKFLDYYSLNNGLIDVHNRQFNVGDFEKLDTLKFYLKKTKIRSSDIGKYYQNKISLEEQPIDSVLFVRRK
ncbi:hypothetical protein Q0590_37155 [Rhodocytophaga aerolata]|uniref:Uncharacterized protein n=1 Tax=Rhodocytophaga aerolata TaxID=455078 RepID=A0ABT8RIL8_9BACT|nr:hypothetical protein [Rhodocytophaga aerolata]MDO1451957.1 hypothetical protein [Rhodocytophaga aerolata]